MPSDRVDLKNPLFASASAASLGVKTMIDSILLLPVVNKYRIQSERKSEPAADAALATKPDSPLSLTKGMDSISFKYIIYIIGIAPNSI